MNQFKKATRHKAKLRLALIGPSGSGKTFSALQIAKGLGGKIAMLDTERGSGSLYADRADYDVLELAPPFTPGKYVEAIKAAEAAGYTTLIIDSLSHAWAGEGGILDIHDNATKGARSGNGYVAWKEVTPQHEKIVNAILGSSLHIIGTVRTKTAYEIVEDERGKKAPKKIGLAPIQRAGLEYEFTVVLDLAMDTHVASASKDRTGLFDASNFLITESHGVELLNWLESGAEPVVKIDPLIALRQMIAGTKTIEQLGAVWADFTPEQRALMNDAKNVQKDFLANPPALDEAA